MLRVSLSDRLRQLHQPLKLEQRVVRQVMRELETLLVKPLLKLGG